MTKTLKGVVVMKGEGAGAPVLCFLSCGSITVASVISIDASAEWIDLVLTTLCNVSFGEGDNSGGVLMSIPARKIGLLTGGHFSNPRYNDLQRIFPRLTDLDIAGTAVATAFLNNPFPLKNSSAEYKFT